MRRRSATFVVAAAVVGVSMVLVRTGGTAAKVPNHGFPVYGSACGMRNALSVNTPVAKRYARMACLPDAGGTLKWQREPARAVPCASDGAVWGAFTCGGRKWANGSATFSGSMTEAVAELARVVASTHVWSSTSPPAPSGSTYVSDLYVRSPVEDELRERLATDGFSLNRTNKIYILEKGQDKRCLKWVDPWPAGWAGDRELRTDALVDAACPTGDIRTVYAQIETIALEAGALYHSDQAALIARKSEFIDRVRDTGFTGGFTINHTRDSEAVPPGPNFSELTFYVVDQCMKYVHNNGAPYLRFWNDSSYCE